MNAVRGTSPLAIAAAVSLTGSRAAAQEGTELPVDLSPLGMFLAADWLVKAVLLLLLAATLLAWIVWVAKLAQIGRHRRRLRAALFAINKARTLADADRVLRRRAGAGAAMVAAAVEETGLSAPAIPDAGVEGIKERVASRLARIELRAGRSLMIGTGVLATIGSTAPFVGLFGTIWGIMNAFIGISEARTTNLAIVAPGIAEALLATALGLFAAIPAVVFYNHLARAIRTYRQSLGDAGSAIARLVSRDLDFRRFPDGPLAGPADDLEE